jgi:prevent-host-death family protein
MEQIGSYEAKTHLPQLLERVAKGERITITKHGVPVAVLVPIGVRRPRPSSEVVAELRHFRQGNRLEGASLKGMIEEGRR